MLVVESSKNWAYEFSVDWERTAIHPANPNDNVKSNLTGRSACKLTTPVGRGIVPRPTGAWQETEIPIEQDDGFIDDDGTILHHTVQVFRVREVK